MSPLDDFPGKVKNKVNGDTDVSGGEVGDVEGCEDGESVEEDDNREEDQRDPSEIGLEGRLEDQRVAVNTLRFERAVEFDVGNANTGPGE